MPDKQELIELMKTIAIAILIFAIIFSAIFIPAMSLGYFYSYQSCHQYMSLNPDYNINWGFFTGCMIQLPDGLFVSTDRVEFINGKLNITEDK